jgi:dolichyl-phosphate beta-glucosyltransferase
LTESASTTRSPPFLSVVVPVFEGARVIRSTIDEVQRHAGRRGWDLEIIVAECRSRDRTAEVVAQAAREYANVTVLDASARPGKGGAVKMGMAVAQGEVRCFIDADNAVSFDQIDSTLPLLGAYDVVIGSRYTMGGDPGKRPLRRTLVSRGGNILMRLALGLRYADTRAPLKVFRAEAAERLFGQLRLRGFGFDSELLFLADRYGLRVAEMPVSFRPFEESTVRIRTEVFKSILELLQVRWNWFRGRYRP